MKVKNISENSLIHLEGREVIKLQPEETSEVLDKIAKIWIKSGSCEEIKEVEPTVKETKKTTKKSSK